MKTLITSSVLLCLLTGCFFTKEDQGNKVKEPQKGTLIHGLISMEDIQGFSTKGIVQQRDILAGFVKKTDSVHLGKAYRQLIQNHLMQNTDRAESCKVYENSVSREGERAQYLSVGKLGIAHESSNQLLEIPATEEKLYYGKLTQGTFPAGMYSIVAEGTADVSRFSAKMSMPELLDEVAVNEQLLANGPVTLKLTEDLKLKWKSLKGNQDYDQVFLELSGQKNGKKYSLVCNVREKEVYSMTTTQWTVASKNLAQFSTDMKNVEVSLLRAHLIGASNESIGDIEFDGIRAWMTTVTLEN